MFVGGKNIFGRKPSPAVKQAGVWFWIHNSVRTCSQTIPSHVTVTSTLLSTLHRVRKGLRKNEVELWRKYKSISAVLAHCTSLKTQFRIAPSTSALLCRHPSRLFLRLSRETNVCIDNDWLATRSSLPDQERRHSNDKNENIRLSPKPKRHRTIVWHGVFDVHFVRPRSLEGGIDEIIRQIIMQTSALIEDCGGLIGF